MHIPDRLETDRLIVRPFEPKDFDAFEAFMGSEDTQIDWSIPPVHWNRGYATESTQALINISLRCLNLTALQRIHTHNLASINAAQKVSMKAQGTVNFEGFEVESVCYKIIKKELMI